MSSAFVLMPFGTDFDPVYSGFIKPVLEEAGLEVYRADDMESQQNILKDVMGGIGRCDLIVADLTSSNPNVYYELGVAHASKKPTIHLTQSFDDVPFDLRSYRLIEYDTHFSRIGEAREKLGNYATSFVQGTLLTGNPVTDFYPRSDEAGATTETGGGDIPPKDEDVNDSANEDELGFLDYVVEVIDSYQQIGGITKSMAGETETLVAELNKATQEIERINANGGASSAKAAQSLARRLASKMESFNTAMTSSNKEFSDILENSGDSLERVVSFHVEHTGVEDPNLIELMEQLEGLLENGSTARDALTGWVDSMKAIPRVERRLNRAMDRGTHELLATQSNLDRLLASISRALNKIRPSGALLWRRQRRFNSISRSILNGPHRCWRRGSRSRPPELNGT